MVYFPTVNHRRGCFFVPNNIATEVEGNSVRNFHSVPPECVGVW